jgi:hypothetical protein
MVTIGGSPETVVDLASRDQRENGLHALNACASDVFGDHAPTSS